MIQFHFDPEKIKGFWKRNEKAFDLSFRWALNQAIRTAREIADKELRTKYGITDSGKTKLSDYLETNKLKLKEVRRLNNEVDIRAAEREKRGLLNHVLGPNRPQHLEGPSPRDRRKIFVKLAKIGAHPYAFIATPKTGKQKYLQERGRSQVFTRGKVDGKSKMFRPTIPDAKQTMSRDKIQAVFERMTTETMEENFYKKLDTELEKLNREPLTKKEQRVRNG